MENVFKIQRIGLEETLPIRHQVLWPNKPMDFCRVENDEEGEHFGVFIGDILVCVASVFYDGEGARLRKFATLPDYQGQGIGSIMLTHIIDNIDKKSISCFWCDARESALMFYKRFGMIPKGERFYKEDVPCQRMSLAFLFAQRSWQTRQVERNLSHPD